MASVKDPGAWVGVDLDGTLATYDGWKGPLHIGEPIEPMVHYVQQLLDAGVTVKIFTARAGEAFDVLLAIDRWCQKVFGRVLPITNKKDFGMLFCVDDRAYQVEPNTGRQLSLIPCVEDVLEAVNYHYSTKNPDSPTYVK